MQDVCPLITDALAVPAIPSIAYGWLFTNALNPAALALATINLGVAVPFLSLGRLVQGAFTQPILFFFRTKRKGFGQVYESLSKRPVDLAVVRVIDADRKRIVMSRVTDSSGRFLAILQPGRYQFLVSKPGHDFPSRLLAGDEYDAGIGRIYTGGILEHDSRGPLEVNLPIDSPEDNVSVEQALRRQFRRSLHAVLAYSGVILGAVSTIVAWNWQSWLMLAGHVLLFLIFSRLSYKPYGRPWGKVADQITDEPLPRSVVRILDSKFNRVLETVVTDRRGQYGFIVGKNTYRLFADRASHEPYRSSAFRVAQRSGIVRQNVTMQPSRKVVTQQGVATL